MGQFSSRETTQPMSDKEYTLQNILTMFETWKETNQDPTSNTTNKLLYAIRITKNILNDLREHPIHQDRFDLFAMETLFEHIKIYNHPNISVPIFIMESFYFLWFHPEFIEVLRLYTSPVFFNVNKILDQYCDTNSMMYRDKEFVHKELTQMFPHMKNADEKLILLIETFQSDEIPLLDTDMDLRRCVDLAFPGMEQLMSQPSFINGRFTSTTLEPVASCPVKHWMGKAKQMDQILVFEKPLPAIYIGFLSYYPIQNEVLLGPGMKFTKVMNKTNEMKEYLKKYPHYRNPVFYAVTQVHQCKEK